MGSRHEDESTTRGFYGSSGEEHRSPAARIFYDPTIETAKKKALFNEMLPNDEAQAYLDSIGMSEWLAGGSGGRPAVSPELFDRLLEGFHIAMDEDDLRARIRAAHQRLLEDYAEWGGYRYHGWTRQSDPRNFYGPVVWSEHDCVHRFSLELERVFPGSVHAEFMINKAMVSEYDPNFDPSQKIDLVVSEFDGFAEDENSQDRFRSKRHEVFIEAKWLKKGRWTKVGEHIKRATDPSGGIAKDLSNLVRALDRGRCAVAAMLVFDDECFLDYHGDLIQWPDGIEKLIVSPSELQRRQLGSGQELSERLAEIDRLHSEACACRTMKLEPINTSDHSP